MVYIREVKSGKMKKTLRFFPEISRRFPDPLKMGSNGEKLNIEHHLLISSVKKIPEDQRWYKYLNIVFGLRDCFIKPG